MLKKLFNKTYVVVILSVLFNIVLSDVIFYSTNKTTKIDKNTKLIPGESNIRDAQEIIKDELVKKIATNYLSIKNFKTQQPLISFATEEVQLIFNFKEYFLNRKLRETISTYLRNSKNSLPLIKFQEPASDIQITSTDFLPDRLIYDTDKAYLNIKFNNDPIEYKVTLKQFEDNFIFQLASAANSPMFTLPMNEYPGTLKTCIMKKKTEFTENIPFENNLIKKVKFLKSLSPKLNTIFPETQIVNDSTEENILLCINTQFETQDDFITANLYISAYMPDFKWESIQ